jgi:tetratricopeptide (TPR) repeat protein
LVAGVDFEEAAGKHRAGDPVKSLRFFDRAIVTYDEGLRKFPNSFDLAYNKARVQYEVATHPKLAKQLQSPLLDVLRAALSSHDYALKLDENDADLLFNTSQVLTSIAEELANSGTSHEAIRLLQSALKLQARCFSVQQLKYAENLRQQEEVRQIFENAPADQSASRDNVPPSDTQTDASSTSDDGQWALVVEPVTIATMAETVVACLATMTTLCTTIASSGIEALIAVLPTLADENTELIGKTTSWIFPDQSPVLDEIRLADTILKAALLDAAFVFEKLDAETYARELGQLWDAHRTLQSSPSALLAHANALISFNSSISTTNSDESLRWTALSTTITALTNASKLPSISAEEKFQTHLLRGDVSLLLCQLRTRYKPAASNAAVLLKNAVVFYRNAALLSMEQEAKDKASFKAIVAQTLGEKGQVLRGDLEGVKEKLQEMLDDGLLVETVDDRGETVYT